MPTRKPAARKRRASPPPSSGRKKTLRLDQELLDRARQALGVRTETDAVTQALESVVRRGSPHRPKSRSFWNDALAAQCSRLEATLITSKAKDFRRLRRHLPVEVLEPFPA